VTEGRIPVSVLGATGSVGQRFICLLARHPWFEIAALTASPRSTGKSYGQAVRWVQSQPLPREIAAMPVVENEPSTRIPIAFSALDASVAGEVEANFARAGSLVVSNASAHRMDPDVPLVVPEVNPDHLELARHSRHPPGAILANPNCSTIGLVLALKPIRDRFGVGRVSVVTMQAISGAGLPGVASYEILDNVIPFIAGEEEKLQEESRKIFGTLRRGKVAEADLRVSAQCNRVPVVDGHLLAISFELERKASLEEVRGCWSGFRGAPQEMELPSAPRKPVHVLEGECYPQPRLHRDLDSGMAVTVGRLRPCSVLDFKFVALSHNTVRGAAGGALLLAELAVARGLLETHAIPAANTTG
jgi:aspartate-semialdehyde dehydrogenase